MPRGHEHDPIYSLSIYLRFSGQFFLSDGEPFVPRWSLRDLLWSKHTIFTNIEPNNSKRLKERFSLSLMPTSMRKFYITSNTIGKKPLFQCYLLEPCVAGATHRSRLLHFKGTSREFSSILRELLLSFALLYGREKNGKGAPSPLSGAMQASLKHLWIMIA